MCAIKLTCDGEPPENLITRVVADKVAVVGKVAYPTGPSLDGGAYSY